MFCNSCKSARPQNEAPCPMCGAPSPLLEQFQGGPRETMEPVATAWNAPAPSQNQNMSMELVPMPAQLPFPAELPQLQQFSLPVQSVEQVYIPPMYIKPRKVISRARIINGILSVFVMGMLLCGGSVYYANVTGKVTAIQRLLGILPPPNVHTLAQQHQIPDPPDKVDWGPAHTIIPAASTTLAVDPQTLTPRERDTIFRVGVPFYVTFSVVPPKVGNVVMTWNMNGHLYKKSTYLIDPKVHPSASTDVQMTYLVAAQGTVELDWMAMGSTPKLAQKLYFSVR